MTRLPLTGILVLLACVAVADPTAAVRCHEIAFSKSAENRNVEAFRSFLDEDARFLGNAVRRGPDEIVAAWQVFFADDGPDIKWRPVFVELLADGTLALTRGPYRTISKDEDGKVVEHWGTFNSIWRKDKQGQWKVVFDAGNSAATPPDNETRALIDAQDNC